jgi:nucleotide-binding universal stress UspA family protein
MPQLKKILFPVDFSNSCLGAARYVEAFAGQFEAEITFLHAVSEHDSALLEKRKAQLDAFIVSEVTRFPIRRVCTVADDPSRAIAEAVRSWSPDLLMMPTHGLGFFRRHLLGSVTSKMLHDLKCPIWTAVHAEIAPPLEQIHCCKILCSIDLTEHSRDILEWAAWLAREFQATLGIVHAIVAADGLAAGWQLREELGRYLSTQAQIRIEGLQKEAGTKAQVFINPGTPKTVVANAASEFNADLLVIGRHGHPGVIGDFFPNATAILRESPCPVISI